MHKLYMELIRMRFLTMLAYRVNYYSGIIIYAINIGAYYFCGAQSTAASSSLAACRSSK